MPAAIEKYFKNLDKKLQVAIQSFWLARTSQQQKQLSSGIADAGTRGAVTGGGHMSGIEALVVEAIKATGIKNLSITIGRSEADNHKVQLELPGYYRPEKKWDMIVRSGDMLVAVIEFKSQVGPSFGNNANNRAEEAIGSAEDFWKAYREQRFGEAAPKPFLGYFFLLEDCPKVHNPVKLREPYYLSDPAFRISDKSATYAQRYEILGRRLLLENLYSAACLVLSTNELQTRITEPATDLSFQRFISTLIGHINGVVLSTKNTK